MASDKLWDGFLSSLSQKDTDKLSDFISFLNPTTGTSTTSFDTVMDKEIEEISDYLLDYNKNRRDNSLVNDIQNELTTKIKDNISAIDPCAPRENLESDFYAQFSNTEAEEVGSVLKHIFDNNINLGGEGDEAKHFSSFESFFEYLKAHPSNVSSIMDKVYDVMGSLPCYHPFNINLAKNFKYQQHNYEASITEIETYSGKLVDNAGNPLVGYKIQWKSSDTGTDETYGEAVTDENGNYSLPYSRYNVEGSNIQSNAKLNLTTPSGAAMASPKPEFNYPPLPDFNFPLFSPEDLPLSDAPSESPYKTTPINGMFDGNDFTLFYTGGIDESFKDWLLGNGIHSLDDVRGMGNFMDPVIEDFPSSEPIKEQAEKINAFAHFSTLTDDKPLIETLFNNGIKDLDTLINTPPSDLLGLEGGNGLEDNQNGDYLLSEIAETAAAVNEMIDNTIIEWSTENE
jgi:hypothetical protein